MILPSEIKNLKKYAAHNLIYLVVGGYFFVSVLLKAFTSIDITIPCLFKTFFNIRCPGCGLTHAFIHIIKLELADAWTANPIAFILIPAGSYYIIKDYLKFRKTTNFKN